MLQDWADLMASHLSVEGDAALLAEAMALAQHLDPHLLDTIYHALALAAPVAVPLTADGSMVAHLGSLERLQHYSLTGS
ncbi:hypothetical protein [Ideonella sp.]|jgi:hypothetical protein|uniref:hypothetical protein n=1 Tax=Ideonella sp. TaxID=1929293 RepID=UPI0037C10EFA